MVFKAEILEDVTSGPYYKIRFYFEKGGIIVKSGYAELLKHSPKPVITFDSNIENGACLSDMQKVELELLSKVLNSIPVKKGKKQD